MDNLRAALAKLDLPVSEAVCTEADATSILEAKARQIAERELDIAYDIWEAAENDPVPSEEPAKKAYRTCSEPKVYAICQQARNAGWSPCDLCEIDQGW